jgi:hypothetical protein
VQLILATAWAGSLCQALLEVCDCSVKAITIAASLSEHLINQFTDHAASSALTAPKSTADSYEPALCCHNDPHGIAISCPVCDLPP